MNQLIVNADDFGIHPLVNKAIIEGHAKGIITSTTVLANGDAFEEALALHEQYKTLGVGAHLALVGGLKPVSDPAKVPTLVNKDGVLHEDHVEFIKRAFKGQINFNEVYYELEGQLSKLEAAGLSLTHVDGHQHLHVFPQVLIIVMSLMKEHHIKKLRIPQEKLFYLNGNKDLRRFIGKAGLSHYAHSAKKTTSFLYYQYPRYFWGMMNGGNMTEANLLPILKEVRSKIGTHEIMVHPGWDNTILNEQYHWNYHWEEELQALTSPNVLRYIRDNNIRLVNYKDVT